MGQAEEVERLRHLVKEIPSSDPVIDDVKDREVEQDTSHVEVAAEAEAETEEKGGGEYSAPRATDVRKRDGRDPGATIM